MNKKRDWKQFSELDVEIIEDLKTVTDLLDSGAENPNILKTGFSFIDNENPLEMGNLTILSAYTSVGKTSFFLNLVRKICHQYEEPVILIFNIEMNEKKYMERLLLSESQIPRSLFYRFTKVDRRELRAAAEMNGVTLDRGQDPMEVIWDELCKTAKWFRKKKVIIYSAHQLTLSKIKEVIDEVHKKYGKIHMVGVDYVQDIKPEKKYFSKTHMIEDYGSYMKSYAKEYNTCMVGLAQLNGDFIAQKRLPQAGDTRDCKYLPIIADDCFIIHRELCLPRDMRVDSNKNKALFIRGKARYGASNVENVLYYDEVNTNFFEPEEHDDNAFWSHQKSEEDFKSEYKRKFHK